MDILEQLGPFINIISTVIAGILVWALKGTLSENKRLRNEQKQAAEDKVQAANEGILALLRVRLIDDHEKYMERGYMANYAFENWERMYKAYRGLGGNGMVVQMDEDIKEIFGKRGN